MRAYIKKFPSREIYFTPLNPTGRWNLESHKLFIEHTKFFLRYWIDEEEIVWSNTPNKFYIEDSSKFYLKYWVDEEEINFKD